MRSVHYPENAPTQKSSPLASAPSATDGGAKPGMLVAQALAVPASGPLASSMPIAVSAPKQSAGQKRTVAPETQRFYGLPAKTDQSAPKAHKSKYGPNAVQETAVRRCALRALRCFALLQPPVLPAASPCAHQAPAVIMNNNLSIQ